MQEIKGLGEDTLFNMFPELSEKILTIEEIINLAKEKQSERLSQKKKPLKVLDNIINGITDGVQGNKIYEINDKLVNLKKPILTETAINNLEGLIDGTLESSGRDIKNVLTFMKRDGLDKTIGEVRYPDYLMPFKKLEDREKLIF